MPSYDTVTEAINALRAKGFTEDFNLAENCLVCNAQRFQAEDLARVDLHAGLEQQVQVVAFQRLAQRPGRHMDQPVGGRASEAPVCGHAARDLLGAQRRGQRGCRMDISDRAMWRWVGDFTVAE